MTHDEGRITQFDGLRALAFLGVFVHHALRVPLLWMGVDLFFVLSGFLITRNLLSLRDRSTAESSLATFYYRRALRIVPPYYLALTAMVLVQPIAQQDATWYYGFASNVRDSLFVPLGGPYNSMWSIAVEEQFYLFWPWLVLFLPRRWLAPAFLVVAATAPLCRFAFTSVSFNAVHRLTPSRMDLLAAGALLADVDIRRPGWIRARRRQFLFVMMCGVGTFSVLSLTISTFRTSLNLPTFNVLGFGLSTLCFVSLLAYVRGTDEGPIAVILSNPILQYVGRVSYMCYLTHLLALGLLAKAQLDQFTTAALGMMLTIAISSGSWYGLERPLMRLRDLVNPKRRSDVLTASIAAEPAVP